MRRGHEDEARKGAALRLSGNEADWLGQGNGWSTLEDRHQLEKMSVDALDALLHALKGLQTGPFSSIGRYAC